MLVKLSEGIGGFSYAACRQANGGDVRFALGLGGELASEVVTWNPSGASEFYVRVPELVKEETRIYLFWGNASAPTRTQRLRVWDDSYTAVWGLDDQGSGIADKSGNGNCEKQLFRRVP